MVYGCLRAEFAAPLPGNITWRGDAQHLPAFIFSAIARSARPWSRSFRIRRRIAALLLGGGDELVGHVVRMRVGEGASAACVDR